MAYANIQKNGSLDERMRMDTRKPEIPLASDGVLREEIVNHQANNIETSYNDFNEQIHINITDDVDDEAVYGKKGTVISMVGQWPMTANTFLFK